MSKQGKIIAVVFLLLVGASAVFLARLNSAGQALGQPGLRLAAMKLFNEDSQVVRTNGVALPAQIFDCTSKPTPVTQLELDWLPPDTTYGRRRYSSSRARRVCLLVRWPRPGRRPAPRDVALWRGLPLNGVRWLQDGS